MANQRGVGARAHKPRREVTARRATSRRTASTASEPSGSDSDAALHLFSDRDSDSDEHSESLEFDVDTLLDAAAPPADWWFGSAFGGGATDGNVDSGVSASGSDVVSASESDLESRTASAIGRRVSEVSRGASDMGDSGSTPLGFVSAGSGRGAAWGSPPLGGSGQPLRSGRGSVGGSAGERRGSVAGAAVAGATGRQRVSRNGARALTEDSDA